MPADETNPPSRNEHKARSPYGDLSAFRVALAGQKTGAEPRSQTRERRETLVIPKDDETAAEKRQALVKRRKEFVGREVPRTEAPRQAEGVEPQIKAYRAPWREASSSLGERRLKDAVIGARSDDSSRVGSAPEALRSDAIVGQNKLAQESGPRSATAAKLANTIKRTS